MQKKKTLLIILTISLLGLWYLNWNRKSKATVAALDAKDMEEEQERYKTQPQVKQPSIKEPIKSVFPLQLGSKADEVKVLQLGINLFYEVAKKPAPFKTLVASWGPLTQAEVKKWFGINQIYVTQYNAIVAFINQTKAIQNSGGNTNPVVTQFLKLVKST